MVFLVREILLIEEDYSYQIVWKINIGMILIWFVMIGVGLVFMEFWSVGFIVK